MQRDLRQNRHPGRGNEASESKGLRAAALEPRWCVSAFFRIALAIVLALGCMPAAWSVSANDAFAQQADSTNFAMEAKDDKPALGALLATQEQTSNEGDADAEDQKAVDAVEELIKKLPEASDAKVTDKDTVDKAKKAYNELTTKQKGMVDSKLVEKLDDVSTAVEKKVKDKEAADKVTELIRKLPKPSQASVSDRAAVEKAFEEFNKLTRDQQDFVSNDDWNYLNDVLAAVVEAEKVEADKAEAAKVEALINALPSPGSVTPSDRAAADNALAAYNGLNGDQQQYVSESAWNKLNDVLDAVEAAEEAQRQAEEAQRKAEEDKAAADAVLELINKLPDSDKATPQDRQALDEAQSAYDALTDDQKALLPDAQSKLETVRAAVEAAEASQQAIDNVLQLIAALPDPASAKAADKVMADAAKKAYDALTDDEKKKIPEVDKKKLDDVIAAVEADASSSSGPHYVSMLLLKWDKPDDYGERHFVGDAPIVEKAYKNVSITEFGETVQLTGWYASNDGTGVIYQTADSSTDIGSFELTWQSSDEEVATVSPSGLVTPRGKNGEVTITAIVADKNVYEGTVPTATVTIVFDGQEGKYVSQVDILDDEGSVIGERWGGVTVYDDENAFHQLHVRVTWHDVATGNETVVESGSGDDYDQKALGTTVKWNVSTSSAFTINTDTGRLRTGKYSGNAYITCTVVGGLGGKDVVDSASVQLDTGTYEYNPADSLNLKVVYEERPDEVVKEATYSYDELLGMLAKKHINATVVNASRFGTISADGFLFKDVVNLVAVDDADVLQYRFTTADGYDNPVSYKYLFESGPRYYFPNYDLGGSHADGEIVPPLLAYSSTMEWGASQISASAKLDDANRFRLVFGCLASGDANTSFQIYYIKAITVVLEGAPPAGDQSGTSSSSSSSSKSSSSSSGGNGSSSSSSSSSGSSSEASSSSSSSSSSGDGPSESHRNGGNGGSSSAGTANKNGQQRGARSASADGSPAQMGPTNANAQRDAKAGGEASDQGAEANQDGGQAIGDDAGAAKKWRVYQMMNKNNSDVPDWDDENPFSPFAAPIAIGTFAVGAGATGIGFRRRLK